MGTSGNKYHRTITGQSEETAVIDIYDILNAFPRDCPAQQHALKKLLCPGLRGKGSEVADLEECRDALDKAIRFAKRRAGGQAAASAPTTDTAAVRAKTGHQQINDGEATYMGGRFVAERYTNEEGVVLGYRVVWSVKHPSGTRFIAGHYLYNPKENLMGGCERAAEEHAKRLNDDMPGLPIEMMHFIDSLPEHLKK